MKFGKCVDLMDVNKNDRFQVAVVCSLWQELKFQHLWHSKACKCC